MRSVNLSVLIAFVVFQCRSVVSVIDQHGRQAQFTFVEPLKGLEAKKQLLKTTEQVIMTLVQDAGLSFPFVQLEVLDNLLSFYSSQFQSSELLVYCPVVVPESKVAWEAFASSTSIDPNVIPFIHDGEGNPLSSGSVFCPFLQYAANTEAVFDSSAWSNTDLLGQMDVFNAVSQAPTSGEAFQQSVVAGSIPYATTADSLVVQSISDETGAVGYLVSFEILGADSDVPVAENLFLRDAMAKSIEIETLVNKQQVWPFAYSSIFTPLARGHRRLFEDVNVYLCPLVKEDQVIDYQEYVALATPAGAVLSSRVIFNGPGIPPFCPILQSSPLEADLINYDLFTDESALAGYSQLVEGGTTNDPALILPEEGTDFWVQPLKSGDEIVGLIVLEPSLAFEAAVQESASPVSQPTGAPVENVADPSLAPSTGSDGIATDPSMSPSGSEADAPTPSQPPSTRDDSDEPTFEPSGGVNGSGGWFLTGLMAVGSFWL